MELGIPELLIILVIVIVLFGPGRLAKVMGELGNGLKSFKDGLAPAADEPEQDARTNAQ
jgi:sec-independent protein translocase protein TatA